MKTLDYNKIEY